MRNFHYVILSEAKNLDLHWIRDAWALPEQARVVQDDEI